MRKPVERGWTPVFHAIAEEQTSTIYLIGDFDDGGVEDFERAVSTLADLDLPWITVDLSDLTSMTEAGQACLHRAEQGGVPLRRR